MNSKRMGALALTAVAAVAMGGLVSSGANARVVSETKLGIARSLPLYHGKVKSTFGECKPNRKVRLYRKLAGKDKRLGTDMTNSAGKWTINIERRLKPQAKYYAKTKAVGVSSKGTGLSCSRAKSRVRQYNPDL